MKKFFSMFLVFIMMFTSSFNFAFAAKKSETGIFNDSQNTVEDFKMHNIANFSEKDIDYIKKEVNNLFAEITIGAQRPVCHSGFAFDCICFCDLISKYYGIKGKMKESREYLAKKYVFVSEFINYSESEEHLFARFELMLYCLNKACNCLQKNENVELYSAINGKIEDAYNSLVWIYKRKSKNPFNEDECATMLQMVYNSIPDDEEEFDYLLNSSRDLLNGYNAFLYESDILIDRTPQSVAQTNSESDSVLLDKSSTTSESNMYSGCRSENWLCSFGFDESKVYSLTYVLEEILKHNFEFGDKRVHIAFSLFDRYFV